jgi:hypothetical protein
MCFVRLIALFIVTGGGRFHWDSKNASIRVAKANKQNTNYAVSQSCLGMQGRLCNVLQAVGQSTRFANIIKKTINNVAMVSTSFNQVVEKLIHPWSGGQNGTATQISKLVISHHVRLSHHLDP